MVVSTTKGDPVSPASLADVESYGLNLEFTEQMDPSLLSGDGLPFVSLEEEIVANTFSIEGQQLRVQHGRIPYGTPIYVWELGAGSGAEVLYIGMTAKMTPQKRFRSHSAVIKLLADHVNVQGASVYFRLCSRFDLAYECSGMLHRRPIEHFPPDEAAAIVRDVEAYLINRLKPRYNTQYTSNERAYSKPFTIDKVTGISIP